MKSGMRSQGEIITADKSSWLDEQWVDYINAPECNPVSAIFEKGRRLLERKQFIHGEKLSGWEEFCVQSLGITKMTVHMLIAIAQDGRFVKHVLRIPSSWGTLYELTKLDDETFQAALDEGVIHPEMERSLNFTS